MRRLSTLVEEDYATSLVRGVVDSEECLALITANLDQITDTPITRPPLELSALDELLCHLDPGLLKDIPKPGYNFSRVDNTNIPELLQARVDEATEDASSSGSSGEEDDEESEEESNSDKGFIDDIADEAQESEDEDESDSGSEDDDDDTPLSKVFSAGN